MDIKSCSTCKSSSFESICDCDGTEVGLKIVNAGCDDCDDYSKWKFDGLSTTERFKQERNKT